MAMRRPRLAILLVPLRDEPHFLDPGLKIAAGRGFGQGAAEGVTRAFFIRKMLMQSMPIVVFKAPQPQATGLQNLRDHEVRSVGFPAHFLIAPFATS
jgi:hypothetical protein